MERFEASVQYGDWKGSCAADDSDSQSLSVCLREAGYLSEEEIVVAIQFYASYGDFVYSYAYVMSFEERKKQIDGSAQDIEVRKIELQLTPAEFLKLFKRFDIFLTDPHSHIDGQEFLASEDSSGLGPFKIKERG
jgi:hypothetical protein